MTPPRADVSTERRAQIIQAAKLRALGLQMTHLVGYVMLIPNLDIARISQAFIETLLKGLEK